MNQLINSDNLTMSSEQLSELLEIRHDNLRAKALKMKEAGNIAFTENLVKGSGRSKSVMSFDKRNSMIIAAKLNDQLLVAVIDRWIELESNPVHKLPVTFGEALQLAANQAIEIETQNKLIALQAPAVKFVEDYTQAETGSKGFRQVAKLLKVNERVFRGFLVDMMIMYKSKSGWMAYQRHVDVNRFEVITGEKNSHIYNEVLFTGKGINWIAGLWAVELIALGEEK
mgnify:CR=1 FL=1